MMLKSMRVKNILILFLGVYRTIGTTFLGGQCRFEPSCSKYAHEALESLPTHKALYLILLRILKCRPGGPFGYDPVPHNPMNCSSKELCKKTGELNAT